MNAKEETADWSVRGLIVFGVLALAILIGGIGAWSATARLSGAIIANGIIEVASNRQEIQHPEGGVVSEILVDDGDFVNAGDVLLRLDASLLNSELSIVSMQLFEHLERIHRLIAERDNTLNITFTRELTGISEDDPNIQDILDGQIRLFFARRTSEGEKASSMSEQIKQIDARIVGLSAKLEAATQTRVLIRADLDDQLSLLDKGLTLTSIVRGLQREETAQSGQIGGLQADIAWAHGQIAVIEYDIVGLLSQSRENAITTLRDLRYSEIELRERRLVLRQRLARTYIRAPRSGIIYELQVYAPRSVIAKAETILSIIPQDSSLVVIARVIAADIDQVKIGQSAKLRFSAFDLKSAPEITGKVTKISADIIKDERTGDLYFGIELVPDAGEISNLKNITLIPGMAADVFFTTKDRTFWQYIVKPLSRYFSRAFKEN